MYVDSLKPYCSSSAKLWTNFTKPGEYFALTEDLYKGGHKCSELLFTQFERSKNYNKLAVGYLIYKYTCLKCIVINAISMRPVYFQKDVP